jgi:predicted NBD/HSP70 family sugar kinase
MIEESRGEMLIHPANKSLMKEMNCAAVFNLMRQHGTISRAELAKRSGLTAATVSTITSELANLNVIWESGRGTSSGGRKPTMYEFTSNHYVAIGIEISPSGVAVASIGLTGGIKRSERIFFRGYESHHELENIIYNLVDRFVGDEQSDILGIGLGMHGLVDSNHGISIFAPAFSWHNYPWKERLTHRYAKHVVVDNDVRTMAIGEKFFGQAKDLDHFIFLNVGRGIGSAFFVNGKLLSGQHYGSGEIGHIWVGDNGRQCFCGKVGCLSTYASGLAIEQVAQEHFQMQLTAEQLHELANQGNAVAMKLFTDAGKHIGNALAIAINLVDPSRIFISGSVSQAQPWFDQGLKSELEKKAMIQTYSKIEWGPATFGVNSGVVGAASMIIEQLFKNPIQYFNKYLNAEG